MRISSWIAASLLATTLTGCGAPKPASTATPVVVATGFQPDVEFAPYYVAQSLGYYRREGIHVTMNYDRVPDLLQEVGAGRYTFAVTGGDSAVIAAAAGAPITYVMAQYQKYPVGAMSLAPLTSPAQLKGLRIGISAPGNSTDFGLDALLQAGGLHRSDVTVVAIGFTETEALIAKRVDVAMTYIDNEPVQAAALGYAVHVLPVSDYVHLVGSGVVTGSATLKEHPDLVRGFVRATLEGLQYTLQHPDQAFQICLKHIPNLVDKKQIAIARKVLTARLQFQQPPRGHPLGWSNPQDWQQTVQFLQSIGAIRTGVDPAGLFTNRIVNAANVHG